jgi:hypothetical protein
VPKEQRNDLMESRLKASEKLTETTEDTLNWQAQMRAVVANAIGEMDVQEIIAKQIAKAKSGDVGAAKFVMANVLGANVPVTIKQTNVNIITDPATAAKLVKEHR